MVPVEEVEEVETEFTHQYIGKNISKIVTKYKWAHRLLMHIKVCIYLCNFTNISHNFTYKTKINIIYLIGGDIDKGPLLVFLHGGGYSGLTWALLNEEITRLVECHTLAIDLRGHGSSKTVDDYDLSAEVMAEDVSNVVEEYVKLLTYTPEIVLIGIIHY